MLLARRLASQNVLCRHSSRPCLARAYYVLGAASKTDTALSSYLSPPSTSCLVTSRSLCRHRISGTYASRHHGLQRRCLSTETRAAIDKAVTSAPVVLFMKGTPETPQCGFSRASIQILGLQGVDPSKFTAFNVLEDQDLRAGIKEYSDWPTIPQLYVNKNFIGGCDILVSMHQNGELAKMLEEEKVLLAEDKSSEAGKNEGKIE